MAMKWADQIREYVLRTYIEPARSQGQSLVTVRAGDVHKAMKLSNRLPNVCSALGSAKFEQLAGVRLVGREGPPQGSNVYFTFELAPELKAEAPALPAAKTRYAGSVEYLLVYAELIQAARYRGTTTYPAIARIMGLRPSGNYMANETGHMLGEISRSEHEQGRPMLSALVVRADGLPGHGFFTLARELGKLRDTSADAECHFWEKERSAVHAAWQR